MHVGWLLAVAAAVAGNAPPAGAQPCGAFASVNPAPRYLDLQSVTFGDGEFLAVGRAGGPLTSRDGVTWEPHDAVVSPAWSSVLWDGTQFVAGGEHSIATSPDGLTWETRFEGEQGSTFGGWWVESFLGIASNGQLYVAVGQLWDSMTGVWPTVVTSPDLMHWSRLTLAGLPESQGASLQAAAWTGSAFVAVGPAGGAVIAADGASGQWNEAAEGSSIAWSGHELVAVGSAPVALRSRDGVTWEPMALPRGNLRDVTWAGTRFVAVGDDGAVLTSVDGRSWEDRSVSSLDQLAAVAWDGQTLAAVGHNILTSPDGTAWRRWASVATIADLRAVAWNGRTWAAVGARGEIVHSADGLSWTGARPVGDGFEVAGALTDIVWTGTRFVAVGTRGSTREGISAGGAVVTSPDGVTWTTRLLPVSLLSVAWNGEGVLATGFDADQQPVLMRSDGGLVWEDAEPPVGMAVYGPGGPPPLAGKDGLFLVLGTKGPPTSTFASSDGVNWIAGSIPAPVDTLAAGAGRFVAYDSCCSSRMFASVDGVSWREASGGPAWPWMVVGLGDRLIAWDRNYPAETIPYASRDGLDWQPTAEVPALPQFVRGLAFSAGALVGVGADGRIVRSTCAPARRVRRSLRK